MAQLRRDEGVRYVVYKDSRGFITFGVGHKGDTPLTDSAVDLILQNDIAHAATDIYREIPWTRGLSITRLNVLINMAFNLGIKGLLEFKRMLNLLEQANATTSLADFALVAEEMLNSAWANQVGERADRLAEQMRSGIEQ